MNSKNSSPPSLSHATSPQFILGIDLGTSGIRGVVVSRSVQNTHHKITETICLSQSIALHEVTNDKVGESQSPHLWIKLLNALLTKIAHTFDCSKLNHLIVDATSSTVLLCSEKGIPLTDALMYNHQQALSQAQRIQKTITLKNDPLSRESAAQGASCTLAKVLFLMDDCSKNKITPPLSRDTMICHQIDFINHHLCGCLNVTDENNALKLGYDSVNQTWPKWVEQLVAPLRLPKVVKPGSILGNISPKCIKQYGFSPHLKIHAGTTDSIAGFLASGASKEGDTVISLGSTLAIKMISAKPVFKRDDGIYSHKLKNNWLIGGASNAGGAVLLNEYAITDLKHLLKHMPPPEKSALIVTDAYYPLSTTGERFPIANPHLTPKMPPRPKQPLSQNALKTHLTYLTHLIKGLVYIEDLAYKKLCQESGQPIKQLYTVGGGVKNWLWQQCRTQHFLPQIQLKKAVSLEAAYGVTKLIDFSQKGIKTMPTNNAVQQLIHQLNKGSVDFKNVMQVIDDNHHFTPSHFKNGDAINEENTNNGSCKIFAFGQLNQLTEQATLNAFGDFYTVDVLQHPDAADHQNIRNFMTFGWKGIHFEKEALILK